jgi:hypothetical protein
MDIIVENITIDKDSCPVRLYISTTYGYVDNNLNNYILNVYVLGRSILCLEREITVLFGNAMGLKCKQGKNGPIYYETSHESYYEKYNTIVKAIAIFFEEISVLDKVFTLAIVLRNNEDFEKIAHFLKNFKEINSNFVLANKFNIIQ